MDNDSAMQMHGIMSFDHLNAHDMGVSSTQQEQEQQEPQPQQQRRQQEEEEEEQQRLLLSPDTSSTRVDQAVSRQLVRVSIGDGRVSPPHFDHGVFRTEQNLSYHSENLTIDASNVDMVDAVTNRGQTMGLDLNGNSFDVPPSDVYLGFEGINALADFEFPADLWLQDPSPADVSNSPQTHFMPKEGPERPTRHSEPFGTNTHANSPLFHLLDKNAAISLKINLICDFLNDEQCWMQICDASEKAWKNEKQPEPVINHHVRDSLVAITYFILSGRPEQVLPRTLSFRFPCVETIQCLFNSCFSRFLRMYPFVHPTSFSKHTQITQASITYPLFLQNIMIMGALLLPNKEARAFAIELAYITRRAMHDTVVRDELTTDDVWMLSATILITAFGAFSGNKKHTEIAEGYRGSYTVMFSRRGYLRPQRRYQGEEEQSNDWKHWVDQERKRRLFHVWYILEQEISMLNSIPSHVYFTDMRGTMPGPDEEYFADSEVKWREIKQQREKTTSQSAKVRPPSLAALYWLFLRDDFLHLSIEITPLQLRLLQCAVQTQVTQYAQTARFVNVENLLSGVVLSNAVTSHSTTFAQLRHEELQGLLVRWYLLSKRVLTPNVSSELAIACTLMYHLANMELYICFDDVQLLAGKHGLAAGKDILPQFQRWAKSPASMKALAHAGQVIRTLQKLFAGDDPDALWPLWWPVAVSRVALVLWSFAIVDAVLEREKSAEKGTAGDMPRLISINDMSEEAGPYGKVIQHNEGTPCLSNYDSILFPLNQIADVLTISLDILERGMLRSTPLCESVYQFLQDIKRCGNPY
ncbi:hypothetical protein LTR99_002702 [Exophiala xenobiotica]|uniref:Xylanolytic transcriptional activator regulatory domain-containing protein n=1 Tax=Vermiconidia calcicola TaxID=1690605 RepID=A0AAV9QFL9_9PEZI|nr:hypothetical protein LTR92_005189 [Exophiala xenobiotica]KAK5541963.1 hypothetical protein LTR25_001848 [Vermiconidia calcicola]KAK5543078.1 hypothetical protein LTR23_005119 [Chaetothyriales sp. CCFEE 6169]KAK5273311.1 hypothetical protein LTR96_002943 [Exophiala xenobiotica]KAK5307010.1 hypothetical protein LTR99_002702 [Exophiala xenobiotica]